MFSERYQTTLYFEGVLSVLSRPDMERLDALIKTLVAGDRIRVTFQNRWSPDHQGQLYFLLAMARNGALEMGMGPLMTLKAVADSGNWAGFMKYTFTIGDSFDAEQFATYTVGRDMVTNIEKL